MFDAAVTSKAQTPLREIKSQLLPRYLHNDPSSSMFILFELVLFSWFCFSLLQQWPNLPEQHHQCLIHIGSSTTTATLNVCAESCQIDFWGGKLDEDVQLQSTVSWNDAFGFQQLTLSTKKMMSCYLKKNYVIAILHFLKSKESVKNSACSLNE